MDFLTTSTHPAVFPINGVYTKYFDETGVVFHLMYLVLLVKLVHLTALRYF